VVADTIRAAGGVLWRRAAGREDAIEVALVHRPRYDDWTLPKGKVGRDESDVDGALREVREETGHDARPGPHIGVTTYSVETASGPQEKRVRYWAMEAAGEGFTPNAEVDELRWLPLHEARSLLTHEGERAILDRFAYQT